MRRKPRWEHWLLNSFDEPVKRLDGVTGGSITLQGLTRLGGRGELKLDERGQQIDWMRHRVQHIYDPGDGTEPWAVGTMMLSSPVREETQHGTSYSVETFPKTQIVNEDAFDHEFSVAEGTPIIPTVVQVLESTGETRIAVTPSSAVMANPKAWNAGTSKLTIANDLLMAAGYWSLFADGTGQLRVEPYVDPEYRPVAYEFRQGHDAIHMADWSQEQDLSSVPNKFIVVGQGSDDAPPLVGVAINTDPASRFSVPSRGRVIARIEEGFDGVDEAAFHARAQQNLIRAMTIVEHVKATHAIIPLSPNDVVLFEDSGYRQRLTVQNMEMSFAFDSDVRAQWRRTG